MVIIYRHFGKQLGFFKGYDVVLLYIGVLFISSVEIFLHVGGDQC